MMLCLAEYGWYRGSFSPRICAAYAVHIRGFCFSKEEFPDIVAGVGKKERNQYEQGACEDI